MARIEMGGGKSSKKIVVKQDMIDFIKNQGMTAALKRAGELKAKGAKGEAEFLEGVRRMYGAKRLEAATTKASGSKAGMPGKGPLAKMTENAARRTRTGSTFNASRAASASLQGANARDAMKAGRTTPKSKPATTTKSTRATRDSGLAQVTRGVKRVLNSSPGPQLFNRPKSAPKKAAPAPKYNRYTREKIK